MVGPIDREDHAKAGRDDRRPWSTQEVKALQKHATEGLAAVADALGRSSASVRSAASRHRISLRTTRAGAVLGQPRGVAVDALPPLMQELRQKHLAGDRTLEIIEQRVCQDARHGTQVCPACGRRPARVQASGLCFQCHVGRLVEAHEERRSELLAQAELWKAQQRSSRLARALKPDDATVSREVSDTPRTLLEGHETGSR